MPQWMRNMSRTRFNERLQGANTHSVRLCKGFSYYTVASGARAETERAAYEQARRVCAARLASAPSAEPQDPPPGEGVGLSGWLARRGNEWRSRSGHGPHGARDRREINPRDLSGVRFPNLDFRKRTGGKPPV